MPLNRTKLKSLRESRGLTQAQAAKAAEMPSGTVWSDYENGHRENPKLATLELMAKALNVKACDLIDGK